MNAIPAAIGMQMAIVQKNATMGMMKAAANADQALVNMVAESAQAISASGRGGIVNISA